MNGSLRPLHVSGGCSSGYASDGLDHIRVRFDEVDSYLNPNARCPKCNKPVYFYKSPYNGRVFFDDVGWPWPKHGCFVSEDIRDDKIVPTTKGTYKFHLRDSDGNSLDAWKLTGSPEVHGDGFLLMLSGRERHSKITLFLSQAELSANSVLMTDLETAPAIILPKSRPPSGKLKIGFLSARLGATVSLRVHVHSKP